MTACTELYLQYSMGIFFAGLYTKSSICQELATMRKMLILCRNLYIVMQKLQVRGDSDGDNLENL